MAEAGIISKTTNYSPVVETFSDRRINPLLTLFAFFLAFPAITILGNSITFYIFLFITLRMGSFWRKKSKGIGYFFVFLFWLLLSVIAAPYSTMPRHPGILSTVLIVIQYTYWIMLAIFFIIYRNSINIFQISKWVFYGCIASIIGFYFANININLIVAEVATKGSRNGFVFTLLSCAPIVFYYVRHRYGGTRAYTVLGFFIVAMFFTNGRSGAIIIMLEGLLIISIIRAGFRKYIIGGVISLGFLVAVSGTKGFDGFFQSSAVYFDHINPRFANLLRGEGEGDLTTDKSWLIRELMIDKGKELIKQRPFLGVGPNGFIFYDAKLKSLEDYGRLQNHDEDYYNSRSSHNSYLQVLAEFGYIGFISFILLLFIPLVHFLVRFIRGKISFTDLPLISLLGLAIHFYAISAITGAISWFVIGLSWSAYLKSKY